MKNINRICIVGGSGTGKTTLAKNLGKVLNLPILHIDGVHHYDNWKVRDKSKRDKIIKQTADESRWIIDGTYSSTLEYRLERADLVILLDYSSVAQLKGIFTRLIKDYNKERPEIPGCKEQMNWSFLKLVVNYRRKKRPGIIELINRADSNKVCIFKNRRQLNKWFKEKFNKKIEL